jgi:uncharacterized protein (TIGR02996 family)
MNDEAAFLAAIQAAPEDGNLRLAYADWLEERGDVRGEYLRLEQQLSLSPIALRLVQLREQIDPSWIALVRRATAPMAWYSSNRVTRWRPDAERELLMYLDEYDRKWPTPRLREMYQRHLEHGGPA